MIEALIPTITALGAGYALFDYKKRRFSSPEDRYMRMYGKDEWSSNDMDMYLRFDPKYDSHVKEVWKQRLDEQLHKNPEPFCEVAKISGVDLTYHTAHTTVEDLLQPRNGLYFDMRTPGEIHIIWNHMQMDGVSLWRDTRPLYDYNPPLVPYREVKKPPPLVPEILSSLKVGKQLITRGSLYKEANEHISTGYQMWDAAGIRQQKDKLKTPFNLLTSATIAEICFARHPDVKKLNLGITVYFPFLKARNRYGLILVTVKRGSLPEICAQLRKKVPKPMLIWGTTALQAYAMERVPDRVFLRLMKYYRKQIDVLVSNVPVGKKMVSVGDVPVEMVCHTRGLSLPYYFLLMGTRNEIHVSYTSLHDQHPNFAAQPQSVSVT